MGRKGPAASATQFRKGTRKRGLDGRTWVVTTTVSGVRRWAPAGRAAAPRKPRERYETAAPAERARARRMERQIGRASRKITAIAVHRPGRGWETNAGRRRKFIWIHVSAGYVYLSYALGRAYWVLRNISPRTRPRITFAARTNTMKINTYRVRFEDDRDFKFAQKCLAPFGRAA